MHSLHFETNKIRTNVRNSFILAFIFNGILLTRGWMPDVHPEIQAKQDKIIAKFFGNSTDYFKVLDYNDENILVGARDVMYNISLKGLVENSRLQWYSSDADRELCALKGKHEDDCHNYLRVFARVDENTILLCGTNSYKPRCRHYKRAESEGNEIVSEKYEVIRDVEAQGLCPYSPMHNSTYAYADGQLYSATVADFSGSDPLIYRENLRTEQYDLKQLNQPDFVGTIEYNGYILFFFREISIEYMNFGKTIYSRVARVCKNDRGGPYALSKSWTSFLKARLNCSVPGEFPFYFDEIQAISPIIDTGNVSLIYAVFTTSVNAIPGSAICAFNVDEIMNAFEGRFKSQKDSNSQWLPIQDEQVPEPRPGQCVEDSRTLSSMSVNFVKNHPLMETAISSIYSRPLLTKVNLHHRLTSITIDPQILSLNGDVYDVIYTGTDDGKVTKFINIPMSAHDKLTSTASKIKTIVISEMQVLPNGFPVRELVISSKANTLLVVGDGSLVTVPLHHCVHVSDCLNCLSLQDPNCAWDNENRECKNLASNNNKFGTKMYIQSLNSTKKHAVSLCPKTLRATLTGDGPAVASEGKDFPVVTVLQNDDEHLFNKKHHYLKVGNTFNGNDGIAVPPEPTGSRLNLHAPTGVDGNFILNGYNDDGKITLHSVDPQDLMNSYDSSQSTANVDEQRIHKSESGLYGWVMVIVIVFAFGIAIGCWSSKCRPGALDQSHRNQLHTKPKCEMKQNCAKDKNRLIASKPYLNPINIDLQKDRSHECKNSTENLEKELPCKTSTLTKVKRTYI